MGGVVVGEGTKTGTAVGGVYGGMAGFAYDNRGLLNNVNTPFGSLGGGIGGLGNSIAGVNQGFHGDTSQPGYQNMFGSVAPPPELQQIGMDQLPQTYQAKDIMGQGPLQEYAGLQANASAQNAAQTRDAQDAMQRRFAAMGMLNSGAAIKNMSNLSTQMAQQGQQSQNQIGFQEAQQRRGLQEAENQRAFQSGEAGRQRQFQATMYNAELPAKQYELQLGQIDATAKLKGLELAYNQQMQDASNSQFNKQLEVYKTAHSGGLLGAGGMLGLGFGPNMS